MDQSKIVPLVNKVFSETELYKVDMNIITVYLWHIVKIENRSRRRTGGPEIDTNWEREFKTGLGYNYMLDSLKNREDEIFFTSEPIFGDDQDYDYLAKFIYGDENEVLEFAKKAFGYNSRESCEWIIARAEISVKVFNAEEFLGEFSRD